MPPASVVRDSNPEHLSSNEFLVNLAVTFNVTSIPLAIFVLIIVLIACVLFLVVVILIARSCLRRKFVTKKKRRAVKSIYLDEIPGAAAGSEVGQYGQLEYSLEYNLDRQQLNVGVIQATNLVPRPGVDEPDPYVSLTLLRQEKNKTTVFSESQKTAIRKKSRSPCWQHMFNFSIRETELRALILVFDVFDYDSIGQDSCIGQFRLPLVNVNQEEYAGKVYEHSDWLAPGELVVDGIGELCIGLSYYSQFNRIDITVYEARQLTLDSNAQTRKDNRLEVQVEVKHNKRSLGSSETKSRNEIVNPYFNEKMSFSTKTYPVGELCAVCRLRRHGRMGTKHTLGSVTLGGNQDISTGRKQWDEMVKTPGKTYVMWHTLVRNPKDHSS
ncbi:Synaptotagmin-2 [Fasciola hepatica]|uniref:Synaptotagmin-2 n=1 Tax=Fasciola hepatica TaxID=6192 RepID=A0A2H1CL77_FASHE|nr:Synaptotagmin-2 [Fasciola hepatica]